MQSSCQEQTGFPVGLENPVGLPSKRLGADKPFLYLPTGYKWGPQGLVSGEWGLPKRETFLSLNWSFSFLAKHGFGHPCPSA